MASESEHAPGAELAHQPPARPPERGRRAAWPWLVILGGALLGLVLRGRSLGSSAPSDALSRPTFVIAASVSPLPGRSPTPVIAASPDVASADAGTAYDVQPGDTLRSIALKVYGDADAWPRIYAANRALIGADPDALQAGMRLTLP